MDYKEVNIRYDGAFYTLSGGAETTDSEFLELANFLLHLAGKDMRLYSFKIDEDAKFSGTERDFLRKIIGVNDLLNCLKEELLEGLDFNTEFKKYKRQKLIELK